MDNTILMGQAGELAVSLLTKVANRHGFIARASHKWYSGL